MNKSIFTVDTHTMGEPTRIITGGIGRLPGKTMGEKQEYFAGYYDQHRSALMHEPRGHQDMFGAVITEPCHSDAEMGVLFMHSGGYLNMCVHGTIGTITAALEIGIVEPGDLQREIRIDTPAGMVSTRVKIRDDRVAEVSATGTPSFVFQQALEISVPEIGKIPVDIVFSGSYFAIVEAGDLGITVENRNLRKLIETGTELLKRVNESVRVRHPIIGHLNSVDLVKITEDMDSRLQARNIVVFGKSQFDRSPCGTGTCAKMALLHSERELALMQEFRNTSIIGTEFKGRLLKETLVGEYPAVIPEITGSAYITGIHQFIIHPDDPFSTGFLIQ